jgi:hypothetical protein
LRYGIIEELEKITMIEQITEEFFQIGQSFEEFTKNGTTDEQKRIQHYYDKSAKIFSSEDFYIDLDFPVHLIVLATPWCWDCQTNIPILGRIAENSPNIHLKIFNKDKYPFMVDRINNGEKVPQVLVYSKDFYFLDRWVERTTRAYKLYADVFEEFGWNKERKNEFTKEYRKRFLKQQKEIAEALIQEMKLILRRTDTIQASTARLRVE